MICCNILHSYFLWSGNISFNLNLKDLYLKRTSIVVVIQLHPDDPNSHQYEKLPTNGIAQKGTRRNDVPLQQTREIYYNVAPHTVSSR